MQVEINALQQAAHSVRALVKAMQDTGVPDVEIIVVLIANAGVLAKQSGQQAAAVEWMREAIQSLNERGNHATGG